MSFTEFLPEVLAKQGRTARPGQMAAAKHIDKGDQHVALMGPTGSGKSAIGLGFASFVSGKAVYAVHTNGLVAQISDELDAWRETTGKTFATLAGQAHYWCQRVSPSLVGLTAAQRNAVVAADGFFPAAKIDPQVARNRSLAAFVADEIEDDENAASSPCSDCSFKDNCPLQVARREAEAADIVITNTTLLALKLGTTFEKSLIILDEAHAAAEPIRAVLSRQITFRRSAKRGISEEDVLLAAGSKAGARELLGLIASNDEHPLVKAARGLLAASKNVGLEWAVEGDVDTDIPNVKVTLRAPINLTDTFADRKVVAMSGTLTQNVVNDLGLSAKLVSLQGLDVSASTVTEVKHPAWSYADNSEWAEATAQRIAALSGQALVIFQSNKDLDSVVGLLPAAVQRKLIKYSSGVNRAAAVDSYRADFKNKILVGFSAGLGTGVDLPNDLVRTVVITRVPQNPPKGADRAKWLAESSAAVVQSVGRGHRNETDWCEIVVQGGWGNRTDIKGQLAKLGWKV